MKTQNMRLNKMFTGVLGLLALAISCLSAIPTVPATAPALLSSSAGGNSYASVFSADGRYLVFVSQANNLVTNDDLGLSVDIFVRDLTNQKTTLVSVNTNGVGGGNFNAVLFSVSSNGQFVAFESAASDLAPGDTNNVSDVFVRDLVNGTTRLVSTDITGAQSGNGPSGAPVITPDGRWIIFESAASNLVAGVYATNFLQIYARDLQSNTTFLVSLNAAGTGPGKGKAEAPAISRDARYIAFVSTATNLAAGVTNLQGEIYLRDMATGTTTWASSNAVPFCSGFSNGYRCLNPVINADGTKLAYKAAATRTNFVLVFLQDLATGNLTCVTSNSLDTSWPELSSDGRFLAYEDGTNILVWDAQLLTNLLVNVGFDGQNPGNGPAKTPVFSADGRTIAFLSSATDLIASNAPASDAVFQVYVRRLESNQTELISANLLGSPSSESLEIIIPALSPDGRLAAFESADDNLVLNDQNRASDIFLRNLDTAVTGLVSTRPDSRPARTGTGHCYINPLGLSADGRFALISSLDNTLAGTDTNSWRDLYWLDLQAATNLMLMVPTNGLSSAGGPLVFPVMSASGNAAAFIRQTNEGYVFNPETGAYALFNLNPTGGVVAGLFSISNTAPFDWSTSLSPDGRLLAMCVSGTELVQDMTSGTYLNIILRDLAAGTNCLVSHSVSSVLQGGNGNSSAPMFSPDGRWLAFTSRALNLVSNDHFAQKLFAFDLSSGALRVISPNLTATGAVFSANGRYMAFYLSSQYSPPKLDVYRHDLIEINPGLNPTNLLVASDARNPSISSNGQWVAYQSFSTTNPISDVYVKDLESGRLELVSVSLDGVLGGNGASFNPQISSDGRFVLFSSKASNLVPNDTNGYTDVFLRDRQLGLTYLLSANPKTGHSANGPSATPVLSADGSTIIFASLANDLAEADYNDKQDIFVVKLARGDGDADDLDDAWEMAYFGNLAQTGSGDADGDGLKDREEYRAGTDPTNQGSVLRALAVAPVGGQSTTLMWPAATGRQYQIQFKRSVTDTNWTDLPASVTVTGNTASAVDTQAGLDAARFYRILILP